MTDTHSHIYSNEFESDLNLVIQRAKDEGVEKIFMPAISKDEYSMMMGIQKKYPEFCFPMMGLHPCYVKEDFKEQLDFVQQKLSEQKFYGIGECGLDFYWDTSFKTQQQEAFEQQIIWAKEKKLPLIIHSRNSTKDCLDLVEKYASDDLLGIFHCFSGTLYEAERAISLNFYLGIGGVITYKNSGLAEIVERISLNKIVLETDAPYLSPVPFRGKRNESSYLKYIAEKISHIKSIPVEDVSKITTLNSKKIFGV